MIFLLALLAAVGAGVSLSNRENDESDSDTDSRELSNSEISRTYSGFASGYDADREIWWARQDTWHITKY